PDRLNAELVRINLHDAIESLVGCVKIGIDGVEPSQMQPRVHIERIDRQGSVEHRPRSGEVAGFDEQGSEVAIRPFKILIVANEAEKDASRQVDVSGKHLVVPNNISLLG